jgi:hypothetical protein
VVLAVENNATMRRMYRALGIKAVNVGELPPATRKATTVMETRAHFVDDMEIRAVGDKMTFKGYAAVFDSDSEPLPFIERISRVRSPGRSRAGTTSACTSTTTTASFSRPRGRGRCDSRKTGRVFSRRRIFR